MSARAKASELGATSEPVAASKPVTDVPPVSSASHYQVDTPMDVEWDAEDENYANVDDEEDFEGQDNASDEADDFMPVAPTKKKVVRRRDRGKFIAISEVASSSSIPKRKRTKDDNTWIINGQTPGGPIDGSVIPSFGGHIAHQIWNGLERSDFADMDRTQDDTRDSNLDPTTDRFDSLGVLICHNRSTYYGPLLDWFNKNMGEIPRGYVLSSGLHHLPSVMFRSIDAALISAFVERWQPDTNTFHLPFGEMTITLHDVYFILGIPVEGRALSGIGGDDAKSLKVEMQEILCCSEAELLDRSKALWLGGGVKVKSIIDRIKGKNRHSKTEARGFLLALVGSTLFVDKSGSRLRPSPILEINDLTNVSSFSWGSATLAYMYRQLGIASRASAAGICGCLTLLQAWIYEYFPIFRPNRARLSVSDGHPRCATWDYSTEVKSLQRLQTFRLMIDGLTASQVCWMPYGVDVVAECPRTLYVGLIRHHVIIEPYLADRVTRQFGFIQSIPLPIPRPETAYRPIDSLTYEVVFSSAAADTSWRYFPRISSIRASDLTPTNDPSDVEEGYMTWFELYSHRLVHNVAHQIDYAHSYDTGGAGSADWYMNEISRVAGPLTQYVDAGMDEGLEGPVRDSVRGISSLVKKWNRSLRFQRQSE